MTNHIISKDYDSLRGFSTDSIFVRPAVVADKCVNMQRFPNGSFGPRRGYQAQTADIGGLGYSNFENSIDKETQDICISNDGNLYKKRTGSITISFNGSSPREYVSYQIFIFPFLVSDTTECNFDPFGVVAEEALVNDSLGFEMSKVTEYTGQAVGAGTNHYIGVLPGAPIQPGRVVLTDGTLTITDDANGTFTGDVDNLFVSSIVYASGAYDVTFSGNTGAVTASYLTTLQPKISELFGKGFDTNSPYLIATLIPAITSIAGVTITSVGNINNPAAFLEVCDVTNIADGQSVTIPFYWWEAVNRTLASTFSGLLSRLNFDDFQTATFAAYQEVVYIGNPNDEVMKYDGQTVYRAGMPNGIMPTAVDSGGGAGVDAGDHTYYITYQQIDATGRLVEGALSVGDKITLAPAHDVNVTVNNLTTGSGWNTDAATIPAGAQGPTNIINVSAGHTMRVGDVAFFIDSSNNPQQRLVTGISATSITIDGAAVTVDGTLTWQGIISNNLSIRIFRTQIGGTIPFLVKEIPNDPFNPTTVYLDSASDASLTFEYQTPLRRPDPPPKTGVVFAFENQMIYTRDPAQNDFVWFSEPEQPEYVSQEVLKGNNFIVPSNDDDVTGVGQSGTTLVVFKDRSLYSINGEIATGKFTVLPIAAGSNIGAVTHHAIVSVGSLLYFLHTNGVYGLAENNLFPTDKFGNPVPLSIMIDKLFRETPKISNQQFKLQRAIAANYTKDNQFLLFLPCEEDSGPRAANDHSQCLCYDYQGKNWFQWTRINTAGGMLVKDDNLYWQERRKKNSTITANTYKQHRQYRLIDQSDHVSPIRVTWTSSWEDLGQPRVRKKFVRCSLLFDNISSIFQLNQPKLCFKSFVDWNGDVTSTQTDLITRIESTRWTILPFNWTTWAGFQDTFITVPLKQGTVSKSVQVQLQLNKLNTSFSLQGFQIETSPDFRKTIVR